jgi:hypothetical protein
MNAEDVAPRWASVTTEARGGVLPALSVRMIEPPQGAATGADAQVHRDGRADRVGRLCHHREQSAEALDERWLRRIAVAARPADDGAAFGDPQQDRRFRRDVRRRPGVPEAVGQQGAPAAEVVAQGRCPRRVGLETISGKTAIHAPQPTAILHRRTLANRHFSEETVLPELALSAN